MLTTDDWTRFLETRLERSVRVSYCRARTQPVRALKGADDIELRLHSFFETADEPIQAALSDWLRSGKRARRACRLLDEFIERSLASLPKARQRRVTLRQAGLVHDLAVISRSLLEEEFATDFLDQPSPGITWGRRGRSQARRSLQLGSYVRESHLIRVHPVLDHDSVPDWFVRCVLHHELLHAALACSHPEESRRQPHGPRFQQRERSYRDFEKGRIWEAKNVAGLIRAARAPGTRASSEASR